jgi:hypothetical protein
MGKLVALLELQRRSGAYGSLDLLANFLDTHDTMRIMRECAFDGVRVRNALAFTFFTRGMPILYYGTEQGFGHEDVRTSLWQTGFATAHKLYRFVSQLNLVRKELFLTPSDSPRLLALSPDNLVLGRRARCDAAASVTTDGDGDGGGGGVGNGGEGGDGDADGAADAANTPCSEVVLMFSSRGDCGANPSEPCLKTTRYCSSTPILPRPPAGWVWADALSGWIANVTSGGTDEAQSARCIEMPDAEPKVMTLLPLANATAAAAMLAAQEARAEKAWDSDFKYI